MANRIALDTNILIYLHDTNRFKREIAENLLSEDPLISTQVVSEYLNVVRRIISLAKEEILVQAATLFFGVEIFAINSQSMVLGASLVKKYQFQLFDSLIVASAIQGNCDILYS